MLKWFVKNVEVSGPGLIWSNVAFASEGTKTMKTSVRIVDVPNKIRIGHLPNASQKRYRLCQPALCYVLVTKDFANMFLKITISAERLCETLRFLHHSFALWCYSFPTITEMRVTFKMLFAAPRLPAFKHPMYSPDILHRPMRIHSAWNLVEFIFTRLSFSKCPGQSTGSCELATCLKTLDSSSSLDLSFTRCLYWQDWKDVFHAIVHNFLALLAILQYHNYQALNNAINSLWT
jgi:hypothetical protein